METKVDTLCLLAQPKEGQQQFKNKKQPELTENRTVWKSDSQGDKEETLTQTSRRGGDAQLSGEDSWQGGGWRTQWSHFCTQINREEQRGSETDHTTPGSSEGK